jgi:branched-chain amino acid transport system permease protein
MDYAIYLAALTMLFISLTVGLRVLVGMCGIISVSQATFFGIGAYGAVLSQKVLGIAPLIALLPLAVGGAILGYTVARSALRIRDDYLVIFTLAVQLIFTNVLRNGGELTGGPAGIADIPPIVGIGGGSTSFVVLSISSAIMVSVVVASLLLDRAPFGRALLAMRDDEIFARSLGRNTPGLKTAAFAISAAMAVSVGAIYPYFTGFIDPTQFTINQSIAILSMVIVGGASRISGAVTGAVLLVLLPEALRSFGSVGAIGNIRQIALGALLTFFVVFRPSGIVGQNVFGKRRL